MKKFLVKGIAAFAALTMLGTTAFAGELSYSVIYDYNNNKATIIGAASDKESKYATLQVLEENKTFAELEENPENEALVLYRYQTKMTEKGFSFTVEYDALEADSYNARLVTGNDAAEFKLRLVNDDVYATAIGDLKKFADMQDFTKFKEVVENRGEELGVDTALYNTLNDTVALEPFMGYVKDTDIGSASCNEVAEKFMSFVIMAALKESGISNIVDYINESSLKANEVVLDFLTLSDTEEKQKYVTQRLSGRTMITFEDFEKFLKEAMIFSETKYASGYGDVERIIEKYGSVIGITGTASKNVYKAMCGKEYEDGEAYRAHYEGLKKQYSAQIGGSGSGSGGGGMSSSKTPSLGATVPVEPNTETPQKFYVNFNDIDGVEWATEAIMALAEKNIINGKSEGYFKPNDIITREEFAKILVCALGYEDETVDVNVFSDVSTSDWFCNYVNIAYNKGIIKGIGNSEFGTGQEIIRQDMMVMLCNAFKLCGIELQSGELTFEDSGEISDYARDAVGALYKMGIINGVSEAHFAPLDTATRAQAAKVVYGFIQKIS